eukprot:6184654-Pleurochrysis_carterae.AAC.2
MRPIRCRTRFMSCSRASVRDVLLLVPQLRCRTASTRQTCRRTRRRTSSSSTWARSTPPAPSSRLSRASSPSSPPHATGARGAMSGEGCGETVADAA